MSKPRIIKDFDKLELQVQEQIKLAYPFGFERKLIKFTNSEGKLISALPFETKEKFYLVRMTLSEAKEIIENDDDYDEDGNLKEEIKLDYEEKFDFDDDSSDEDNND